MDVRIGVTYSTKEIDVELPEDADRAAIRAAVDQVLSSESEVLWLTDRRGREIGVPAAKIAYVEIGSADGVRSIGFGS